MIENLEKMNILRKVISSMEESSFFSAEEFLRGEGLEDFDLQCFYDQGLYSFNLAMRVIENFEEESDQDPREYLLGEGYDDKEIDYILSEQEKNEEN